jgi:isocitrate dehydrogenase (NAD+)
MLNAAVDMLYHLGHRTHADILLAAINKTVNVDKLHTPGK